MERIYGLILWIGPGVLACQGVGWLRTGIWPALPISTTFAFFEWPLPDVSWVGLQKIIDWVFDIPTSLAVFVLSSVLVLGLMILQALFVDDIVSRKTTSKG